MAPALRPEDAREIETASGMPPSEVLPLSVSISRESYTIRFHDNHQRIDAQPTVLFGVTDDPHREGMGVMWLVATPAVTRASISVLREARHWIDAWCSRYPQGLHNIVDTRNDHHIRWLASLGFDIPTTTIDIKGVPFVHARRAPKE
jgi:hypothetical protein